MASPYALDFSPIIESIRNSQQLDLQRNQLGMQQERLGFERDLHPLAMQAQRQAIEQASLTNPLDVRLKQASVGSAEDTLTALRAYRNDPYGEGAAPTTKVPTITNPQAVAPSFDRAKAANRAAGFMNDYVLAQTDPVVGQKNFETLISHPELAKHFQAGGYTAGPDWRGTATRFVQDMNREASGPMGPAQPGAPAAAAQQPAQAQPADPVAAATMAAQRTTSVRQTPEGYVSYDASNAPLQNLSKEMMRSLNMQRTGVPALVTAGETLQKVIQSQIEKGVQLTQAGGVMRIPGANESELEGARAKAFGTERGTDQAKLVEAGRRSGITTGLMDQLEELATNAYKKDPNLLKQATGPYVGDETFQARMKAARETPIIGRALPGSEEAFNLNKRLHHVLEGISAQIKIAASRGVVTDQAQKGFDSAVGKMMETDDPETFFAILHDAKNILRGMGGAMPAPLQDTYLPQRDVTSGGQGRGGAPQIPPAAVRLLQQSGSDPAIVQQFESKYGPGSAKQFLMQR